MDYSTNTALYVQCHSDIISQSCVGKYVELNPSRCTSISSVSVSVWFPGLPAGRGRGRKLEAPQQRAQAGRIHSWKTTAILDPVSQTKHLQGRHLKEGKSYVISAQINALNCGSDRWWVAFIINTLLKWHLVCLVVAKLASESNNKMGNCSVYLLLQLIFPSIF